MNTVWFTADTHFGHRNIVAYDKRPFKDVGEMNGALIERWNARVQPSDRIYHLGDFSLGIKPPEVEEILQQLNGSIHLVHGNHDHSNIRKMKGFQEVVAYKEIVIEKQKIILFHYAMKVWNCQHYGSWQLHGHSHGSLPRDYNALQLDVGVNVWDYAPISFAEVKEAMKASRFKQVDGHKRESDG